MSLFNLFALALALAMDAFAVAIVTGMQLRRVSFRQFFRLAWHFGLFQALMPIIGWAAGLTVRESIQACDHWIAFALLVLVGGNMIRGAFASGEKEEGRERDPTRGATLVVLSLATSIDALAVGLSLSMLGGGILLPALVIGLVAGACTVVGLHLGKSLGAVRGIGSVAELLGGVLLVGIGVKVLVEHRAFDFLL